MATRELTKQTGRPPTEYDPQIAEEICEAIATGPLGLRKLCEANRHWPCESVVRKWLTFNDVFATNYAQARQQQADIYEDELLDISYAANADLKIATGKDGKPYLKVVGEAIQRSTLKVASLKWVMAKRNPNRYGDKLDVTSDGKALQPANSVTIDARVQTIMLLAERRRLAAALFEDGE